MFHFDDARARYLISLYLYTEAAPTANRHTIQYDTIAIHKIGPTTRNLSICEIITNISSYKDTIILSQHRHSGKAKDDDDELSSVHYFAYFTNFWVQSSS